MARIATQLMAGTRLKELNLKHRTIPHFGVKESVFPFDKMPEVDPVLGPEMRSTGEVLGMAASFGVAFYKAQEAAQMVLPLQGTALVSLAEKDEVALEVGRSLVEQGFKILATDGTHRFYAQNGITCERINKLSEGRPNIADAITNKSIQLVINTPAGKRSRSDDSYIRKAAIKHKLPYVTTLAAARAAIRGIADCRKFGAAEVRSLQSYHQALK